MSESVPLEVTLDPVCGMRVDPARAAATREHDGRRFYFCALGCAQRFEREPERYLAARATPAAEPPSAEQAHACCAPAPASASAPGPAPRPERGDDTRPYTCPMHPEVRRLGPGTCPKCGMALEPVLASADDAPDPELADFRRRLWIAAPLALAVVALAMGDMLPGHPVASTLGEGLARWLQLALTSVVVLGCGWPLLVRAWSSLRHASPNMFTLIGLGTGAAWLHGSIATLAPALFPPGFRDAHGRVPVYFEAAASIVALVLLGQVLELRARHATGAAIRSLLDLAPRSARRVRDGREEDVPLSEVAVGDRLRVRPGESVPTDALVLEGASAVDESMLTGEPMPVDKGPGDALTGGTRNQSGSLLVEARRVGADTVLARIVALVAEAQRSRAPLQRLADRVAAVFVPAVVAAALATFVAWALLGPEPRLAHALVNAVAVLIIACPCALGLATPMSIVVASGRGAQSGVLFRDAEAIEALRAVDLVVLDKTGTVTEGRPRLGELVCAQGFEEREVLSAAASLERASEHPLARALVAAAQERGLALAEPERFEARSGGGVVGFVEGVRVLLGNARLLASEGVEAAPLAARAEELRAEGATVVLLALDGRLAAALAIVDPIRASTPAALRALRAEGLELVLLTGDARRTAEAVAHRLGLDRVRAEVSPDAKEREVRRLQDEGHVVAMAGDGVNDAPALARADVGVAMGGGSDVALESAGVTLLRGELTGLVRARRLSRATVANVRQNLAFALVYNALGVPIAAGVLYPWTGWLLSPMLAAAAMSFSSVSVIANALRLRRVEL